MRKSLGVSIAAFVLTTAMAVPGFAAERHVATNGTDSSSCGASGRPCRSITQALANAVAGDTVWVRPGLYGDVNNDGDLDDPGDERQTQSSCMLCIFKDVDVLSVEGAAFTVTPC